MQYTVVFGASVEADGKTLGKVERIIVQNGVANQFTVDPGLFGTERVVPLSDVRAATADTIQLRTTEDDWKAYPAFNIEELMTPSVDPMASVDQLTPQNLAGPAQAPNVGMNTTSVDVPEDDVTVPVHSAVLSAKTTLLRGDTQQSLHGLVLDTGRPVQLLADDGQSVGIDAVRRFTSEQIDV